MSDCKMQYTVGYFYFLKVNISATASYPFLKLSPPDHNIGMEGSVSQIFHSGLRFHFMTKNG